MVDIEVLQERTALDYTKESVKLTKNSKGCTWEIKIMGTGPDGLWTEKDFERHKKIYQSYEDEYGKV